MFPKESPDQAATRITWAEVIVLFTYNGDGQIHKCLQYLAAVGDFVLYIATPNTVRSIPMMYT